MNDIEKQEAVEKLNPILSIWFHPKKTTRYILQHKGLFFVILLMSLGYIGNVFAGLIDTELYPMMPGWLIVLLVFLLSPIFGLISNTIYAFGIWIVGKLFKGIATYKESFVAASLPMWPYAMMIPFYIYWIFADPYSLFYEDEIPSIFLIIIMVLLLLACVIWSIIINIASIAEVHQFSNWRAFFTILILSIITFIIVFAIVFIIGLIFFAFALTFGFV